MSEILDINEIKKVLPHNYPFLLVDRILELEEGKRAVGVKNVTINEHFFQGHFPDYPVMPGVLIIEALAQVGAVALLKNPEFAGKIAFLTGIDKVRIRRQVVPGDQLRLEVELIQFKLSIGKAEAKAFVGDQLVAEGNLMFAIQK